MLDKARFAHAQLSLVAIRVRRTRPASRAIRTFLGLVAGLASMITPLQAATYRVGVGTGCSHATIAAAVAAAETNPGADTILVTRSQGYPQQALSITTAQELDLRGGYATCGQASSDGTFTILDGAGGGLAPVLRITTNTGGLVRLRHLNIRGGDEDNAGYGGGIYFRGSGRLEIHESQIQFNVAGYGGGIYAQGEGPNAELLIGASVIINNNIARFSGGGVYVDSMQFSMHEPGSGMIFNEALGIVDGGYGGGLIVLSSSRPASARISSTGIGGLGVAYANEARYGAGIAVVTGDGTNHDANLTLFSSNASSLVGIRSNDASVSGGGIYVRSSLEILPFPTLATATARLWQVHIDDNSAPLGAAIHVDYDENGIGVSLGGILTFELGAAPGGGAPCPAAAPCTRITNNVATSASGAVIHAGSSTELNFATAPTSARGVLMQGNSGAWLIRAAGADSAEIRNALMVENQVGQQLLRSEGGARLKVIDSTIAGNTIGAAQAISVDGDFELRRSILWQPGKTSLVRSGGSRTVELVIASEAASLGGPPGAVATSPRFVDPERGDYALRAASPAVDYAPADTAIQQDVFGRPRNLRLSSVPRTLGLVRDLGALERQAISPLMSNADFNTDLHLWPAVTAGVTSWDSTQNAAGIVGSGSARISAENPAQPRVNGVRQCIHLPGPGLYALNGSGRGSGFGVSADSAILHWEFRRVGTDACDSGAADASGDHVLARGTTWRRPTTPTYIDVSAQEWTASSSIAITLVANESGISVPVTTTAWFDGITLEIDSGGPAPTDFVFAEGFEGN